VYFERPVNLSYFSRRDGKREYGSTFNPYWQVRLAPMAQAERVLASWIEQKTKLDSDVSLDDVELKDRGIFGMIKGRNPFDYAP